MTQHFDFRTEMKRRRQRRPLSLSGRDIMVGMAGMVTMAATVFFWPASASGDAVSLSQQHATGVSLSVPAQARHFDKCHSGGGRNCVVDGDTFWMDGEKIRVADIDTPETHPARCVEEERLGNAATDRLQALLNQGRFDLRPVDRDTDRYGRKLRIVERNGRSLGGVLVSEGLARSYHGGRRDGWCA